MPLGRKMGRKSRRKRPERRAPKDIDETLQPGRVEAPPAEPVYKLVVIGPTVAGCVESFDSPVVLDLVDLVQKRYNVKIESGVPFPNTLTIVGTSRHSLGTALEDISLLPHRAGFKGHKLLMVQASHEQLRRVLLAADMTNPGWGRFTLSEQSCDEDRGHELLQSHAVDFCSKMAQLAHVLKDVPSNLTLQAHLGRMLTSLQEMSGSSTVHPAVHLGGIMNQTDTKTKVVFDRKIGDGRLFDACRETAIRSKDHFFPCSAIAEGLDDVQSSRFLVIITEAFHIELEICPPRANNQVARLSRSRVFQLVGADGRADLTVACPFHCLDWKLEALQEIKSEDVPLTVTDMTEQISITYPDLDEDFPVPDIPMAMLSTHRIKQVYGKISWTVGCRGSRYLLELCRLHRFPRVGKSEGYSVSTGISVSSTAWADAFKAPPVSGVCRDLGASWSRAFRPRRNRDGMTDFLNCMQSMVTLWGGVFASAGAVAAPDAQQQEDSLPVETDAVERESAADTIQRTQVPYQASERIREDRDGQAGQALQDDVLQQKDGDLISFD